MGAMSLLGVNPLWAPGSGIGLRVQRKAKVSALPSNQTCRFRKAKPAKPHISEYEMLFAVGKSQQLLLSSQLLFPVYFYYGFGATF